MSFAGFAIPGSLVLVKGGRDCITPKQRHGNIPGTKAFFFPANWVIIPGSSIYIYNFCPNW